VAGTGPPVLRRALALRLANVVDRPGRIILSRDESRSRQVSAAPWYHGLVYTTTFMLIVLGIPATCLALWVLFLRGAITRLAAVGSALCMIVIELIIGGGLFFVARQLSRKYGPSHDRGLRH
jgi:hypothetical protein